MSHYVAQLQDKLTYLLTTSRFEEMLTLSKRVLAVARRQDDVSLECMALVGLATALRQQGKFHEARVVSEGAIDHARKNELNLLLIDTLIERGFIVLQGYLQAYEAMEDFKEALKIAAELEDKRTQGQAMAGIALANYDVGYIDLALAWAKEGLNLAREATDPPTQVLLLYTLARIYVRQRRLGRAEECIKQANSIIEKLDYHFYTFLSFAVMISADITDQIGDPNKDFNLKPPVPFVIVACQSLITVAEQDRELEHAQKEALEYLAFMQAIKSKPLEASAFSALAHVNFLKGDYDTAQIHYEQALLIARETMNPFQEALLHEALGQLAFVSKNYDSALEHYQNALSTFRSLDHTSKSRDVLSALFSTHVTRFFAMLLRWVGIKR